MSFSELSVQVHNRVCHKGRSTNSSSSARIATAQTRLRSSKSVTLFIILLSVKSWMATSYLFIGI